MRTILALTLLSAGICASVAPEPSFIAGRQDSRDYNFVEQMIVDEIENLQQSIRDVGLDPFYVKKENYDYQLPVPVIFNAAAYLEDILFGGLSNIVIKNMIYSYLLFRLRFELELPHLVVSAQSAGGHVTLFGNTLTAEGSGRVDVRETILHGRFMVSINISQGLHVSRVDVDFDLGRITSHIRLAIQGNDYSENINTCLDTTVPEVLEEFRAEVNELIGLVIFDMLSNI